MMRVMTTRRWMVSIALCLVLGLSACSGERDGSTAGVPDSARVIRIGAPVIPGNATVQSYFGATGIARAQGLFEQEFAADGITVQFIGFPNGPMVAQALANGQIDFAGQGDMISLIARSQGAGTRLILPSQRFANAYLAVPAGSDIRSFEDIRGKRVAYARGNMIELQFLRVLAEHGIEEREFRTVNLSPSASATALLAGQVDAVFAAADITHLQESGAATIVHNTKDRRDLAASSGILVRSRFADNNPQLTQRVVDVLVRASLYGSDEANREAVLAMWATGKQIYPLRLDIEGVPMREVMSPLFDDYIVSKYANTQRVLGEMGRLRGVEFSIDEWIDTRYLEHALSSQGLTDYWTPQAYEASGIVEPDAP